MAQPRPPARWWQKDGSQPGSKLGKDFRDKLTKKDVTAEVLHKLLCKWGYDGVSLEDCTKILSIPREQGVFIAVG